MKRKKEHDIQVPESAMLAATQAGNPRNSPHFKFSGIFRHFIIFKTKQPHVLYLKNDILQQTSITRRYN